MKDICFLSVLYPSHCPKYDKNVSVRCSQNISFIQNELIRGLEENTGERAHLINKLLVPLYKKGYKYPVVSAGEFEHVGGLEKKDVIFPFVNVPFLHSPSLFLGAKRYIKKWALDKRDGKCLFAYSLTSYSLRAMRFAKKKAPGIKTCVIVPDVPRYTYPDTKNPVIKMKNTIASALLERKIKALKGYVDLHAFFSKHMTDEIPAKNFCVTEGIYTGTFSDAAPIREHPADAKVILYGGGLSKAYGLDLLLDGFSLIKSPRYRLVLCGKGAYEDEITERAKKDQRITFKGAVDRTVLTGMEKGADLLVNPRPPDAIFTRYSFPSKNLEYLSSGTPMIGYKLDGIPDEYDEYINYFPGPGPRALADMIMHICEKDYDGAVKRAKKAEKYIAEHKSANAQAGKLLGALDRA